MAVDQGVSPSPSLYRKVAEDIKAAIAAGGYATGTRLPSESELAERYSVSRGTIRQAFAALRADGVIASRRGARRVVIGGTRVQSFGELLSFSRWARALGEVPSGRVIALQRRPAKPLEAERLAVPPAAPIYYLVRVRLLSGRPVMIERGVYPDRVGALVAGMDLEHGSITERLEELGIVFADAEHVIDAVPASAEDARLLGVSPRVPMLRERRLTTDLAGVPVEWSDDRYLGSAVAFSVHNSTAVNALSRTRAHGGNRGVVPPGEQSQLRTRASSSGAKCANRGGVTAGSLAWSSQRRTATASREYGSASNAATSAAVIGPPCRDSVRTDSADSSPKYSASAAHRYRLAGTCRRTGSVTAAPNHWLSQFAPASPCRALRLTQMADVVQQGRGHQRALRASRLGQRPGLQHVLADGHRLAQVVTRPGPGEQLPDRLDRGHGVSSRVSCRGWAGRPPSQHGQGAGQPVQVGVTPLQVPAAGHAERRTGVQDPGVVEDQAVTRGEPQVQLAFGPGQQLGPPPVGRVERHDLPVRPPQRLRRPVVEPDPADPAARAELDERLAGP